MNGINFKQYYLSKCTYWLLAIVVTTIAVISVASNLSFENRFILTGVLLALGINVLLYLNRFEPKFIEFNKDYLEITYYEQRYFGRSVGNYAKNDIIVLKGDDALVLSNDTGKIATIRKKALDSEDWETLKNYFD